MSTERPEFRPLQAASARSAWPFALLGAVAVAALLWVARRDAGPVGQHPVALGNLASKIDPREVAGALGLPAGAAPASGQVQAPGQAQVQAQEARDAKPSRPAESPNLLGGTAAAARGPSMVARSELEREVARSKGAQKQAASYRKQVDELQQRLNEARGQMAAMQKARTPPPPSDQEQILQTLAPVLRASSN